MKKLVLLMLFLVPAMASLMAVSHSNSLVVGEEQAFFIGATNALTGVPVSGMKVEMYDSTGLVAAQDASDMGYAYFTLYPNETGYLSFRLTAEGFNEYVVVEEVTLKPVPTPTPEPTASPLVTANIIPAADNKTSPVTGFISVRPTDMWFFFIAVAFTIVCIFSASSLLYTNYLKEDFGLGASDPTSENTWLAQGNAAFQGILSWLNGESEAKPPEDDESD